MRYVITHGKAPWPEGRGIGDSIEFDAVPEWAAGKCSPAPNAPEFVVNHAPAAADPAPAAPKGRAKG